MTKLVIRTGSQAGMQFPLDRPSMRLGRRAGNDIVLQDPEASRQHAEISRQGDQTFIRDLGSTNGTFVNGQRLQPNVPYRLNPGDQVQLANTVLAFHGALEPKGVSSSGLPYFESTAAPSRRRIHPFIVALLVVTVVLLLGLAALSAFLLTTGREPAIIVATATPVAAGVTPAPTATPTAAATAQAEASPLPAPEQPTPPPEAQATPKTGAFSEEALAWLQRIEGRLFAAGELILKFKSGVSDQEAQGFFEEQGLVPKDEIPTLGLWLVSVQDGSAAEAMDRLVGHPLLSFVDLNSFARVLGEPNDAQWSRQWNMWPIEAPQGWDVTTGSGEVTIAILDTGIDLSHPDLGARITAGYDFIEEDDSPQDEHGHGTHVAGITAAIGNNGEGVAGVTWGSRIMPVRVLDGEGSGRIFGIAAGMVWATDHGARAMNLSLGVPLLGVLAERGIHGGDALGEAVNYAHSHNVLVVAAAGNEYTEGSPPAYPAAYAHVLAVAATNDQEGHAYYSNAGTYVDVAAPGGEMSHAGDTRGVFSTLPSYEVALTRGGYPTGYGALAGTSMAAPHVAGLAALVWSINPGLSSDQVQAIIEAAADDLGPPGWDGCFGAGRINVNRALQATSAGQIPAGGPREHTRVAPSFCPDFTILPEATFPIPAPTIDWSWPP